MQSDIGSDRFETEGVKGFTVGVSGPMNGGPMDQWTNGLMD